MQLALDVRAQQPTITSDAPALAPTVSDENGSLSAHAGAMSDREHRVPAAFNVRRTIGDATLAVWPIEGVGNDEAKNDWLALVKRGDNLAKAECSRLHPCLIDRTGNDRRCPGSDLHRAIGPSSFYGLAFFSQRRRSGCHSRARAGVFPWCPRDCVVVEILD